MKKLVAVTTVILIVLLMILGIMIVKENFIGDGENKTTLSDIKEGLEDEMTEGDDGETDERAYYYDGALLILNSQADMITYEGRDFEIRFANPFYEEGSNKYIRVIFYDEEHGYLLNSLGAGTDSEFFEAYRTEDGCDSWVKCESDLWFDLDGRNHVQMISEKELLYVHIVANESLGTNETEIRYSPDLGDSWYETDISLGGENSEAIWTAIEEMSLEEKVAQLFMISPEALTGYEIVYNAGDATYEALEDYPVGGLIYTADNIESTWQFETMLENVQDYSDELTGLPIFLAVAEEGGEYSVLGGNEWLDYEPEATASAAEIGSSGDVSSAREAGTAAGALLSEYGLNMNLAPVADVLAGNNFQMRQRSFSTDPQTTANMTVAFVQGMQEEDVLAVLKYFPGYSAASTAVSGYPVINRTLEEMMSEEFLPYISAIKQGGDFIMVGHIAVPEITGDQTPASLSDKMIQEVLRSELGFKGIVMTDSLDVDEIQNNYSSGEAAVKALQAGADMLVSPADFKEAYEGVLDAVKAGSLTEDRIDESVYRILRVKLAMMDEDVQE